MPNDSAHDPSDAATASIMPAPTELPRLRVAHLMAWMAATAIAFLPYQTQIEARERLSPGVAALSPVMTGTMALYGVAAGSYLFVIAALAYWRRRGYRISLQPGHWLAIEGACDWLMATVLWLLVLLAQSRSAFMPLVMIPQFLKGLVFFFLFLWLAIRGRESAGWRLAFLLFALAPIAAWVLTTVLAFSGGPGQIGNMFLSRAAVTGGQGLILAAAMAGDVRRDRKRHWSHWLGAGMRLGTVAMLAAYYMYYAMFPGALTGQ